MGSKKLQKGFGVFFDPTKTTSGQRFFSDLYHTLSDRSVPLSERPCVVLFNVSAPFKDIVSAKLRHQKIVLRIDGLYCDRLSSSFIASFKWPLRKVFLLGLKWEWTHDFFAFWANLISQNYGAFARILMADLIIYQSNFSQKVHSRYFPNKPYRIITNGSAINFWCRDVQDRTIDEEIRLVTIYDDWRPSKRIHDIVSFVQWMMEIKNIPVKLTILGYTGNIPSCVPNQMKNIIENSSYIRTLPRFTGFNETFRNILQESDIYITFSYRDACPNTVIESMAHGLPVVGIASGGLPDIVGQAGILLPIDDFSDGFFTSGRYECEFPPIDYEKILMALQNVMENYKNYRTLVQDRFKAVLDIKIVAEHYACLLNDMVIATALKSTCIEE